MGKYVVRHSRGAEKGVVIDADLLEQWVEDVLYAERYGGEYPTGTTAYVAGRLLELLRDEYDTV